MKLTLISMATLIDSADNVYLSIALKDENGNEYTWDMYDEEALNNHFDVALCVQAMRDIEAKQKRAQETQHGDFQYAEAHSGKYV